LEDILDTLQPLEVDWMDDVALNAISELKTIPIKESYSIEDLQILLEKDFEIGLLISRLFLGLSKDAFMPLLKSKTNGVTCGVTLYRNSPGVVLRALDSLGIPGKMTEFINRKMHWTDVLVERLRSGRGSAISGMKRGRNVEDFVENIIKKVFLTQPGGELPYRARCNFIGKNGKEAKCDFAIPGRDRPDIIIEAKGYAATGSKMTDVIGDIIKIIEAKRNDTHLLFFTDGITWRERQQDLRKIIAYQNNGDIRRIYTYAMAQQLEYDLITLKGECGI